MFFEGEIVRLVNGYRAKVKEVREETLVVNFQGQETEVKIDETKSVDSRALQKKIEDMPCNNKEDLFKMIELVKDENWYSEYSGNWVYLNDYNFFEKGMIRIRHGIDCNQVVYFDRKYGREYYHIHCQTDGHMARMIDNPCTRLVECHICGLSVNPHMISDELERLRDDELELYKQQKGGMYRRVKEADERFCNALTRLCNDGYIRVGE